MENILQIFTNNPIVSLILALLLLYAFILLGMYKGQRKLMYHPDATQPELSDYALSESAKQVYIQSHDGLPLYSWYRKPSSPDKPLIIFFHGNAGHIGDRANRLRFFRDQGYGFLISSYRYNAGNDGQPSEENLLRDAQMVINWARERGTPQEQIILYGESLGSGVAVSLAQNNISRAVILEGPYSSITDVAAEKYWFLPVRQLIHDEFDSQSYIGNLLPPVLILHGAKDTTIPLKFAEKLFAAADATKDKLVVFPEGGHIDLYDFDAGKEVAAFIEDNPPLEGL